MYQCIKKIVSVQFSFFFVFQASPRDTVAQRFLAAENQRARELELLIDSHIETLKKGTENTIKRHSKRQCQVIYSSAMNYVQF